MKRDVKYYLINNKTVGKVENGVPFIFYNYEWTYDEKNIIFDHLFGYDDLEPEGSPYGIFSMSIMDDIKEITEEEMIKIVVT